MTNFIRRYSGLLLILSLALLVRIIYLLIYSGLPDWDQLTVDNYYHHNWAISMAGGNVLGDTTYFRAPFYVYCLSLLYAVLGTSLWVGRIFGLLIGVASLVMTYLIARCAFDHKTGLIAATVQAFYPVFIYFEPELLIDPLFTLLLQIAVHRILVWWDIRTVKQIFLAGIFLGLAAITRPTALILVPMTILVVLALVGGTARFRQSLALLFGVALLIIPVTVRNIAVADDPVLVASQGGINLYIGNNESADGVSAVLPEPLGFNWRISQITHIAESEAGRKLKPGEVSSFWQAEALDWILRNPQDFLSLYSKKLYYSFSNREISNNRNLAVFFTKVPILNYNPLGFGILFALTLCGLFFSYRLNPRAMFLITVILTYMIVSSLFFFNSRFRLPLLPFYIVLSSSTLLWLTGKFLARFRTAVVPMLVAIACGLFSYYPITAPPARSASQYKISEGLYHMAVQDYPQAAESFRQALAIDSTFPETNLNLGVAYLRQGDVDSSRHYLNREKRFNPLRPKTYLNLASLHLLEGRYTDAEKEIQSSLESMPYDLVANMLYLRILRGDTSTAPAGLAEHAFVSAERTGYNVFLVNEAAAILCEKNRLADAERLLLRAVDAPRPPIETSDGAFERLFPDSLAAWERQKARVFYQLGFIKGQTGQYQAAIDYSRRAVEADSGLAEAYVNLISGYISAGRWAEARATFSVARQKFPDNAYIRRFDSILRQ